MIKINLSDIKSDLNWITLPTNMLIKIGADQYFATNVGDLYIVPFGDWFEIYHESEVEFIEYI